MAVAAGMAAVDIRRRPAAAVGTVAVECLPLAVVGRPHPVVVVAAWLAVAAGMAAAVRPPVVAAVARRPAAAAMPAARSAPG
jgi:hypothetical protein